jgi:hypothetical protein
MKKGSYSTKYNPQALRPMIMQGKDAREIMKRFHISPYTLNEHVFMLEKQDNRQYHVPGLYNVQKRTPKSSKVTNGFLLSPDLLQKAGMQEGDNCEVLTQDGKIILKKKTD